MLTMIPMRKLKENPANPRKTYNETSLQELAESIKKVGLLQPLVVRPRGAYFEIVCGHRRRRAAALADLQEVPGVVRELDDKAAAFAAVVENLQREDVKPGEESDAFAGVVAEGAAPEEIAAQIGRPVRYVQDRLRLQKLTPDARKYLDNGQMPLGGALILATLDGERQDEVMGMDWGCLGRKFEYGGKLSIGEVRHAVERTSRSISHIPWDLAEDGLAERCACSSCPVRTINQGHLWDDAAERDRCLDASCYEAKKDVWLERQRAAGVIVKDGHVPYEHYSRLDDVCWQLRDEDDNAPTWEALAAGVTRHIFVSGSSVSVAVLEEDVANALRAAGREEEAQKLESRIRKPPSPEDKAAQKLAAAKEREAKKKAKERAAKERAVILAAFKSGDLQLDQVAEPLVKLLIKIMGSNSTNTLLKAHGVMPDKDAAWDAKDKALNKLVKDLSPLGMKAALVEITLNMAQDRDYNGDCPVLKKARRKMAKAAKS